MRIFALSDDSQKNCLLLCSFFGAVLYMNCQEEDKVTTQEVIFLLPKSVAMKQFVPRQLIYRSD